MPRYPLAVLRSIGVSTLASVACSLAATIVVLWRTAGVDFSAEMSVGQVWFFSLVMSLSAPLAICPVFAARAAMRCRELRRARDELAFIALKDPLTGLLNRRGFDEAVKRVLEDPHSSSGAVVAIMCDVDRFKSINDLYGHDFGDVALMRVAEIINASLGGRRALVGRRGGEEFAILITDCGLSEGFRLAQAICERCEATSFTWEGVEAHITLSLGVAAAAAEACDLKALMSRADAALYQAKRDGRNRVVRAIERPRLSAVA
jgi:diguanylate cyclase (GGDEF)-like protein